MVQRQLIEETPWAEARMITPSTNARPGRMDFEHQTHRDAPTSPLVIPELSHLTTQGSTQRSRLSIRHAHEVETEQWARRAPTSLLNNDMMFGERTISGSTQNSFDLDDSDDDLPVARYVPRSHKLIMTRSRNHLQIVPKSSPMSPLNGCDTAPLNQRRRTPAPFHIEAMAGVPSSIASFAGIYTPGPCYISTTDLRRSIKFKAVSAFIPSSTARRWNGVL